MTRKVEVQRKNSPLESAPETPLPRPVPLPINDLEGNVLVRRPRLEPDDAKFRRVRRFQHVLRRPRPVDEIGVENIKFVPLYGLGGRVVVVVVSLVVLVPVVPGLDAVEVSGLARTVPVLPSVGRGSQVDLGAETQFLLEVAEVGLDTAWGKCPLSRPLVRPFLLRFALALGTFSAFRSLGKILFSLFELFQLLNEHFRVQVRQV
mmetsp:Transcript_42320/g.128383  ORF Transcript_42320/g.128383 Transcript_42320/m.128383 type:complete len:205 (-) Transcript_42320:34-648(-)